MIQSKLCTSMHLTEMMPSLMCSACTLITALRSRLDTLRPKVLVVQVSSGAFPSPQHTPYKLLKGEAAGLAAALGAAGFGQPDEAVQAFQAQQAAASSSAASPPAVVVGAGDAVPRPASPSAPVHSG